MEHYECPSCNADLTALIEVHCESMRTEGWSGAEAQKEVLKQNAAIVEMARKNPGSVSLSGKS